MPPAKDSPSGIVMVGRYLLPVTVEHELPLGKGIHL